MGDIASKLASMLLEGSEPRQRKRKKPPQQALSVSGETPKAFLKRHNILRTSDPQKLVRIGSYDAPVWAITAKTELEHAEESEFEITSANSTEVGFDDGLTRYTVYQNEEEARLEAVRRVREDLQEEPEIFNQDWLEGFISIDKLRRELRSDVSNMNSDRWNEEDDVFVIDQLVRRGLLDPDENLEEPRTPEIEAKFQAAKETAAEQDTDNDLEDPVAYLEGIYGRDARKEAIRIAGINYEEAANDAVSNDGVASFLAPYDGQQLDLPSGAVAFRVD